MATQVRRSWSVTVLAALLALSAGCAQRTAPSRDAVASAYVYMQGTYEIVVTGTLKTYDARADLLRIKVPVLSTVGEFDEVGPKRVEAHAKLIPGARFILYKDAAHVTTWDARDVNVRDVREFLRSVDKR